MPSHEHGFMFDVNFNFGNESVFSLKSDNENIPEPPIEVYFNLLIEEPFLLLTNEHFELL